ncbi:MAG TPA: hypothetical protein VGE66_07995 [Chitinophagaceae bacterium]
MQSKPLYLLLFSLLLSFLSWAQLRTEKLTKANLPKAFKYKGAIMDGLTWTDSIGKHFVILTETGPFMGKNQQNEMTDCEGACQDAEVYAYHYVKTKDSSYQLWQLTDFERTCPFDVVAEFARESLSVTDFDRDGVVEVWFVYKTTCTSDVSPRTMKLLMYEEKKKYAARGTSRVTPGPEGPVGGDFQLDATFKSGPLIFRTFAARIWNKHVRDIY